MSLTYGSVCSGIEAASVAWEPLGFNPSWFSEIESFPSAVLQHHWSHVVNLGDMTNIVDMLSLGAIPAPDILVGGTPCQAFSLAGLRGGLSDSRGQLTLEYVRILNEIDRQRTVPAIGVWENVPGVLSDKSNAFGYFIAGLAGESKPLEPTGRKWTNSGYVLGPQRTVAWRVLDAQYFGVAQRRRRVFVVASAREGFDPAKVLFEFDGVRRDIAPSRETGSRVAALTANGVGTCGADDNQGQAGHLIAAQRWPAEIASTLNASFGDKQGLEDQHINGGAPLFVPADGFQPRIARNGRGDMGDTAPCVAYGLPGNWIGRKPENGGNATEPMLDASPCLTSTDRHAVSMSGVRRLTPVECERLQGFPDNHTLLPHRPADGPRYKALGNSMAVPVMRWIGKRIQDDLA